MSSAASDPAMKEVLDFWFALDPKGWFQESKKYDKVITERFAPLVEKARLTDELDSTWTSTAAGSLAMIILLDQFTRNIFRVGNHPEPGLSWSGDAKALEIATQAVTKGFDRQVQKENPSSQLAGYEHRMFFYLPFMHAESLLSQVACCSFYETMQAECEITRLNCQVEGKQETPQEKEAREYMGLAVGFAKKHRNCIAAVGRFPMRNEPLGREHTKEDKEWLEEHPMGF